MIATENAEARREPPSQRALRLASATRHFGKVSARSRAMHEVFAMLSRFAPADVSVTLLGETGVGKEVLAHAIHEQSARADGPFVVFDCGSVTATLAESELLGHERGAFTGAVSAHAGAFERANGGTLFLDEIGELPLDLQPRLLRALESGKVRRVGGRLERRIDVRIVAATNRDLRAEVVGGRFREDLFFRLAVAVVPVPSLRERIDDLPELLRSLLVERGRPNLAVSEEALALLRRHPWPGNVRELKNVIACAVALLDPATRVLEPAHLHLLASNVDEDAWLDGLPLGGHTLARIEKAAIRQTMAMSGGNKIHAARRLGIAVSTLYDKLRKSAT